MNHESGALGSLFAYRARDMARSAEEVFRDAGLEPIGPPAKASEERPARCLTCATTRWVRLSNLRAGGIACRWCHGWAKWPEWAVSARELAATWREVRGPEFVATTLRAAHLHALTELGDEFTPVGVECLRCGETTVVMPERIVLDREWNTCERCLQQRRAKVRGDAPDVFAAHGLHLLGACSGEFVPQPAACLTCGSLRAVSYRELVEGSAPLCWTCTHGIRADEPHRVYLVRFPTLGVFKVGLTHCRHPRRLEQHELGGGEVVQTIDVRDRAAARALERRVLEAYAPWRAASVGPADFPQGGWTETWLDADAAPACDLASFVDAIDA